MNNRESRKNFSFVFECEQCTESWSENLLDLIDRCTTEELLSLHSYIQTKLRKNRNTQK
ncbi:MAG: hypothetical protein ACFFG0_27980 [Candidatus Thorarchaeota archaeon]